MHKINYHGFSLFTDYEETLQKKITHVCCKIGFDDSNVTWNIYNPNAKTPVFNILIGLNGNKYGYSIPSKNEIWISTLSISKAFPKSSLNRVGIIANPLGLPEEDFLANVILDEITHIQTNCNHGDDEYDNKLCENARKYYLSPIEYILSTK